MISPKSTASMVGALLFCLLAAPGAQAAEGTSPPDRPITKRVAGASPNVLNRRGSPAAAAPVSRPMIRRLPSVGSADGTHAGAVGQRSPHVKPEISAQADQKISSVPNPTGLASKPIALAGHWPRAVENEFCESKIPAEIPKSSEPPIGLVGLEETPATQDLTSEAVSASQPAPSSELERRIAELEASLEVNESATRRVIGDIFKQTRSPSNINDFVVFGGLIEVLGGWKSDFDSVEESFIVLDTTEFDFEAKVNDWVTGGFIVQLDDGADLIFETSEEAGPDPHTHRVETLVDRFQVDEAFIVIGDVAKYPLFMTAGRIVVPFGISTGNPVADVLTVSDPLTVEVFETKEDVVLFGYEKSDGRGIFNTGIYVFRGSTNKFGGEDHVEHYGATMGYLLKEFGWSFEVDVDFINSVFDSQFLAFAYPDALEARYVPGMAASMKSSLGPVSLVLEWNGALDKASFISDGAPVSIAPNAWQASLGYQFGWDPSVEAIGLQGTYAALGYSQSFDLGGATSEQRYLVTLARWLWTGTRVSVEYAHDQDYSEAEGGTGRSANAATVQLTYEF